MTEDLYLSLDNENVVILNGSNIVQRHPLLNIQNIISFSYKGASPALMGECVKRNIGLSFFSPYGKLLARINGMSSGNVLLRKEQYRISDDTKKSCVIARNFIAGKIYNAHSVVKRMLRDHPLSINKEQLEKCAVELMQNVRLARSCTDLELLRGIEGYAAQLYWGIFDQFILQKKDTFKFSTRNKRPPKDKVNAVLSLLYVILAHDCASALEGVGLDAYVGFLHRDRPGRKSLALDLIEEMRHVLVDRCVLYLINNRMLEEKHFDEQENQSVMLNDEGRRLVLSEWEKRKYETITHPFLKEKMPYGLLPHIQALLLARYIRGDIEEYPAFLWK